MPKPLGLSEIRIRCAKLAADWREEPGEERQQAQSFVRDLLLAFGINNTKAALYEKRANRSSTGNTGYIDALLPGLCLIEMKSRGADLEKAETQALDYVDALSDVEAPRWIVTCDFASFRVLDLHGSDGHDTETFALDELSVNAESLGFLAGYGIRKFGSKAQETASVKAAQLMARLWEQLEDSGYTDHEASIFMVRTLFALYADDSAVWERDLFLEFIETRTSDDGSDLGAQLSLLYQAMARPLEERNRNLDELVMRFPYVNGGIFDEPLGIPSFTSAMRDTLLNCCAFNWAEISPAIFGSLFQAVKDSKARRELGEHYTTETNILKLIGPMFLDELRQRYMDGLHDAAKLRALRRDMREMRFLDPAAGCGNFLVVSYREMRQLDLDVVLRLQELGSRGAEKTLMFDANDLAVTLDHFRGIEIEEWPAQIARTALHLVEHQANQAMELALGRGPDTLPLNKFESIHVGNAIATDWAQVTEPSDHLYILGNPPFIGHTDRSESQKDDLRRAWGTDAIGHLDYVTAWYAKAAQLFAQDGYHGEFAFVSTNSITQGEPVPALFGPLFAAGWRIKFAHRTFAWTSEAPGAASVHCVIVGMDQHPRRPSVLYGYQELRGPATRVEVTQRINAYLIDGPNVLVSARRSTLSPTLPKVDFGSMPNDGGNLLVDPDEIEAFEADPITAKYLRRFYNARELIHDLDRRCLWMVDLEPSDLAKSQLLKRRVEATKAHRLDSRRPTTRALAATPQLFAEIRHRDIEHLAIPRHVSETRPFFLAARTSSHDIVGDANFAAEDSDGFLFAVLSSSAFIAWQRAVGGRIKSDLRFSSTLSWNTFPLPPLKDPQRDAIIAGGVHVLEARALHPERSLADHYNPLAMDPRLIAAHGKLDKAVDALFGLSDAGDDADRLRVLFASYEKLTSQQQLKVPKARRRAKGV